MIFPGLPGFRESINGPSSKMRSCGWDSITCTSATSPGQPTSSITITSFRRSTRRTPGSNTVPSISRSTGSSSGCPVYLDNQATTRVDPRALAEMLPYFDVKFGNAASINHRFGWDAAEAVEASRGQIARLLNVAPDEILFTSGGTE